MNDRSRVKSVVPGAEDAPYPLDEALRALANPHRLRILRWLADPTEHFPPQRDGDLVEDGVCVGFITTKAGLTQPTITAHMQTLAQAKLVTAKRIKNWVYYKLDISSIESIIGDLKNTLTRR